MVFNGKFVKLLFFLGGVKIYMRDTFSLYSP